MPLVTKKDLAKNVKKMIDQHKRYPSTYPEVICEGCKQPISLDGDPEAEHLDCSVTKRKSILIWHDRCYRQAWDSRIC